MCFIPDVSGPYSSLCRTDKDKKNVFYYFKCKDEFSDHLTISKIELYYKLTVLKLSFNRKTY